MAISAAFSTEPIEHRLQRRRQREFPLIQALLASLIMTLVSSGFVKAIVLSTRTRQYRFSQRVLATRHTALNTLARPYASTLSSSSYLTTASSDSQSIPLTTQDATLPHKPWKTLFDLELPEGRCLGLRLESQANPSHPDALTPESIHNNSHHWIHAFLHPDEVQYGMAQPSEYARHTFFLGRLAMREVLRIPHATSILRDEYGRPTVPPGYLGSISHKRTMGVGTTGVALIFHDENLCNNDSRPKMGIGVDIEQAVSKRRSIASRVLTERELSELGHLKGLTWDEEVLLRFSIKESLYKAMHPLICQYVGCQEAEVTPHENGTASVRWNIKTGAHEQFQNVTVHWRRVDDGDLFLTSACITLKDDDKEDEYKNEF